MIDKQKKHPSNFYILLAMLIAIVMWAIMGPPAMSRNVGPSAGKGISAPAK